MTFTLRIGGIEAGRGALSLGDVTRDGGAIVLGGMGESLLKSLFNVKEALVTRVDLGSLRPRRSSLTATRGARVTKTRTQHRHGGISEQRITRQERNTAARDRQRRRRLPAGHFDPFSALLYLRSHPLAREVVLHVMSGSKSYRVRVRARGRERIRTPGLFADCIVIEGTIQRVSDRGRPLPKKVRKLTLWLSDDAARVPVKAAFQSPWGPLSVELASYRSARRKLTVGGAKRPPRVPKGREGRAAR